MEVVLDSRDRDSSGDDLLRLNGLRLARAAKESSSIPIINLENFEIPFRLLPSRARDNPSTQALARIKGFLPFQYEPRAVSVLLLHRHLLLVRLG